MSGVALLIRSAALCAVVLLMLTPRCGLSQKEVGIPIAWETVSIHALKSNDSDEANYGDQETPKGIRMHGTTVSELISQSFHLSLLPFREDEVIGLPEWAKTERFDIVARVSEEDTEVFKKLSELSLKDTLQTFAAKRPTGEMLMLQELLKDRFGLHVHWEQKPRTAYALTLVKGGLKLPRSSAKSEESELTYSPGHLVGKGVDLQVLVNALGFPLQRTVLDRTGLDQGTFDFDLKWTPVDEAAKPDANDPDFFTAVKEQLGLKLTSTRVPLPVLVIDRVVRPTQN